MMLPKLSLQICVICVICGSLSSFVRAEEWPSWRGPRGDGHSTEKDVPIHWDAKSIIWKTPLPGNGQSSPVVWGERIFLTAALDKGKKRIVFCVDRKTGSILWQREAWSGVPEPSHPMNGWASPTCATDGERVVAFFGKGGLHCYSVDGKHLWSRDLGSFPGPWGTAACPIIVGDLVIQIVTRWASRPSSASTSTPARPCGRRREHRRTRAAGARRCWWRRIRGANSSSTAKKR